MAILSQLCLTTRFGGFLICVVVFVATGPIVTDLCIAQATPEVAQEQPDPPSLTENGNEEAEREKTSPLNLDFPDVIDTEKLAGDWEKSVAGLIDKYDISSSFAGRLVVTVMFVFFFLGLFFISRKIVKKIFKKLISLNTRFNLNYRRLIIYQKLSAVVVNFALLFLLAIGLTGIWAEFMDVATVGEWVGSVFSGIGGILIFIVIAVVIFEAISALIEHYFSKLSASGNTRIKTLLPIVKNVTYGALFIIFGITLISELGIDIMPLLAGAGVVGFAVGFGAQTFIKDLITGFIIIVEDLIQVGDVVTLGDRSGIIEKITIRKVQLRALNGVVYTVPFSEISIVENMTKDFSYYLFNVGIAYRESPDEVITLLKQIGNEMQNDDKYKENILEPIEILGVDQFADSAIIIKARIKTRPIKQWEVGREFNRRMKYLFDDQNIEIPFPHQTLYFGQDKAANATTARVQVLSEQSDSKSVIEK